MDEDARKVIARNWQGDRKGSGLNWRELRPTPSF